MPTVAQLLDRVIKSTGSKYNDRFHIVDMFNDAMNALTDDAKMEASTTITTAVDTDSYDLPADFKAPIALIDGSIANPNYIYPLVNINEAGFGYSLYGGQLYFKPTPSEVKTLNLYYYKYGTQLVEDTDVPDFDPFYHDLLATYAIAQIMLIPELGFDKGTYDRAYGDWERGKQNFLMAQVRKNKRSRVNEKVMW